MKALRFVILLALVAAVAIPTGATTTFAQDGDKTEVTLWYHSGQAGERDELSDLIDSFNETNENYFITRTEVPEGDYTNSVRAASVAGELPCVLDFDGPNIYAFVESGDLIPLDPYLPEGYLDDILPSIVDQGTVDGQLWSLGVFDSGLGIWANGPMLEEAGVRIPEGIDDPWTLDEFNAAMDSLAEVIPEDGYVIDFQFTNQGEWYSYAFGPILRSFGADTINRETYATADGTLNSPEAVNAMLWLQGLFDMGYATATPVDPVADFTEGRVPLSYVGHWMYNPYKEALGDDLVLIPMPDFGFGSVAAMGSWNWGITTNCTEEAQQGAWEFIDYAMQPDNMVDFTNRNGAVPSRISVLAEDERYSEGGDLYIYRLQLENTAVPRAQTAAYPAISAAMETLINAVALGEDVQEALDTAVATIDAAIQGGDAGEDDMGEDDMGEDDMDENGEG
jgi:multiple sugar transport system substrate-binding protein